MDRNWYVAHLVFYYEARSGQSDDFFVWVEMHLISGDSFDSAWDLAVKMGVEIASFDDDSLTVGDVPSKQVFAGVRHLTITSISSTSSIEFDEDHEIGIQQLIVRSFSDVVAFASGKSVHADLLSSVDVAGDNE